MRQGSAVICEEVMVLDSETDPDHLMRPRSIQVLRKDKQETIAFVTN